MRTIMVTGGAGGLGQTLTRRFAASGERVIVVERSLDKAQALVDELGGSHLALSADLSDVAQVEAMLSEAIAKVGTIEVLVHTVGGFAMGQPVHETDIEVWERMMNMNARSLFITAGQVAKHMLEMGVQGKIVAILAKPGAKGAAKMAAYSASKAAAQRIIESMALELRGHGINVNGVVPSIIDTPANRKDMPNADFSKWVTPDQLADAIQFLTSDAASAVHGMALEVFGGV